MKRFLTIGVFFFAAAAMGFGLNLLAVSNASAGACDLGDLQTYCNYEDETCSNPLFPIGVYICGTNTVWGTPCACEFSSCSRLCFEIVGP